MDWLQGVDGNPLNAVVGGVSTMLDTGLGALPELVEQGWPDWAVAAGSALAGGGMVPVTVFVHHSVIRDETNANYSVVFRS
jgi:hypothetical protein